MIRSEYMEVWLFAILMGMWFCALFLITGILIGRGIRNDKGNTERADGVDSDCRVYVPCRDRDRGGDRSDNPQVDEVISVLDTLYVGASSTEKAAIDYAKECIDIAHKLAKYFKGETE